MWIRFPIISMKQEILFLFLRTRAEVWKNVVFLSLWISQLYLDFTDQNSSSCWLISQYSSFNCLFKVKRWAFGPLVRAFWMPTSRASTLIFLWNIFPKISLFQNFIVLLNLERFILRLRSLAQISVRNFAKRGWDIQTAWNLKSLFSLRVGGLSMQSKMGQWSECTLVR